MSQEATYKKIKLNGEDHVLKMDFNAIRSLEESYNKGIFGIIKEEQMGLNLSATILWAAMLWNKPNLQVKHVGNLINEEIENNEEFDFNEFLEFAMKVLTESKVFKLMSKEPKKKTESKNA